MKDDHRSYMQLLQLQKESLKKIQACTGFKPLTSAYRCSALPIKLTSLFVLQRSRVWILYKPATAKVAYITAMIILWHIYDFHIFKTSSSSFHRFITNKFNNLLIVGFFLVERCTGIVEVKGSNPAQASIVCRLSFATAKVAYITAMIILHLILLSTVHIHNFHTFKTSLSYSKSIFSNILATGWRKTTNYKQNKKYKASQTQFRIQLWSESLMNF